MLDLRTQRVLKNLSQYAVAVPAGMSQAYFSQIERGYVVPTENQKEMISRALGCRENEIDWDSAREPGAFNRALRYSDVRALFNHNPDHVLARESSGTLELEEDNQGLHMQIDLPDTSFARDLWKMIERGDIKDQSFAFRVRTDTWENLDDPNKMTIRTIEEIDQLIDVSIVTYPAYPDTTVALRSLEAARNGGWRDPILAEADRILARLKWENDPLLRKANEIIRKTGANHPSRSFKEYRDPLLIKADQILSRIRWSEDPFLSQADYYIRKTKR